MNYTYFNPTSIEFGTEKIKSIVNYIDKKLKVLVVYGGGSIKKNGVYEQVKTALEGYTWFEFGGVEPNPSIETLNKAVKIIEQSFYEEFGKGKVEAVEVTDEAIILSKGIVTNSKGSASAIAIGSGALGSSKSVSKTMHDSQRIYLNSLGEMKLQQSNKNSKNYAVSIFMQDGSLAKHVFFRDEVKAKRFINAMEYLKTDYNHTL